MLELPKEKIKVKMHFPISLGTTIEPGHNDPTDVSGQGHSSQQWET